MGALGDLEEDNGAFADDLVDDESWHDNEEDRAEGQQEVKLSAANVLDAVSDKEVDGLGQVLLDYALLGQELVLSDSIGPD